MWQSWNGNASSTHDGDHSVAPKAGLSVGATGRAGNGKSPGAAETKGFLFGAAAHQYIWLVNTDGNCHTVPDFQQWAAFGNHCGSRLPWTEVFLSPLLK
jgi:hypothetical protein